MATGLFIWFGWLFSVFFFPWQIDWKVIVLCWDNLPLNLAFAASWGVAIQLKLRPVLTGTHSSELSLKVDIHIGLKWSPLVKLWMLHWMMKCVAKYNETWSNAFCRCALAILSPTITLIYYFFATENMLWKKQIQLDDIFHPHEEIFFLLKKLQNEHIENWQKVYVLIVFL